MLLAAMGMRVEVAFVSHTSVISANVWVWEPLEDLVEDGGGGVGSHAQVMLYYIFLRVHNTKINNTLFARSKKRDRKLLLWIDQWSEVSGEW